MPDFIHFFKLLGQTFSLKKGSLHYPSRTRVRYVLLVGPFFLLQLFINQLFLLLDNVFFFPYRFIKVKNPVFIVAVPRSATTFLFHALGLDKSFSTFKLWEIVFAPSIIQKLIALGFIRMHRFIGNPMSGMIKRLENILFGSFRTIHTMGFSLPEEDEALMIYHLSSLYFFYFFPEAHRHKSYLFFDEDLSERKKKRVLNYYYRVVQRHEFVFNPKGKKLFLSKNPSFISRIIALNKKFEDCYIIYLLRDPIKTIPSTISLNSRIFDRFTEGYPRKEDEERAREIISRWYRMSLKSLELIPNERKVIMPFKRLISNPGLELEKLYLKLPFENKHKLNDLQLGLLSEDHTSKHQYNPEAGLFGSDRSEFLQEMGWELYKDCL